MKVEASWKVTEYEAILQLLDLPETDLEKSTNHGQLFEFLQKEWQLRDSLKTLNLRYNEMRVKEAVAN